MKHLLLSACTANPEAIVCTVCKTLTLLVALATILYFIYKMRQLRLHHTEQEQKRQWEVEDKERQRAWKKEDDERQRAWKKEDDERQRAWKKEDDAEARNKQ